MGFFEQTLSKATLQYVSQEILFGDVPTESDMDFDDMLNEANSNYNSFLKDILTREQMVKVEPFIYSYTSDLVDIYYSMGIRAGAKLHADLIGYPNISTYLPNPLSKHKPDQEVHMKSVIQEIFQGTLIPAERFETVIDSYKEKAKDLESLVTPFYSTLSESQQTAFDNIMDAHLGLVKIELEQSFTDGFKTGIRLLHESLNQTDNRFDTGKG